MREDRRKRIKIRQRRRKRLMNWVIYPFCILVIAVTIVANVSIQTDRPRSDAAVTQVLESRGGEVVRIAHYGGFSRYGGGGGGDNGGYVDVLFGGKAGVSFDGHLNRCDLDDLDKRPPVFTAMVTSEQPHWRMGEEPILGCDPGATG
jgi:hypothetical protein